MSLRISSLTVLLALSLMPLLRADVITLVSMPPDVPTGANVNALAGPMFSSSKDTVEIAAPGTGSASTSLLSNFSTHDFAVEFDFSTGPAYFDSSYGSSLASPFSRISVLDHRASAESIFFFTVDVPTVYEVMGFFSVTDDPGTTIAGNVELEIELLEFDSFEMGAPPPTPLFYSWQVSKSTLDQSFEVGGMDGDTTNVLVGEMMGVLDPSKFYRYRTLVTTVAIDTGGAGPTDGGASAFGEHTIMFSAAIPEPTSGALMLFSVLGVAFRKRRRP